MTNPAKLLVLLGLSSLAAACGGENAGPVSVLVVENGVWADVIEGDYRIEGDVFVEREGDVVRIRPEHGADAVARVRLPWAREIRTRGNAEVTVKPFRTTRLELDAGGTSRIEVAGVASEIAVRMRGDAEIDASELVVARATVDGSGNATGELFVTVSVSGSLTGNAALTLSGSGDATGLLTEGDAGISFE